MTRHAWHRRTDSMTVYKRAGGRRKYNSLRQLFAQLRRQEVAALLRQGFSCRTIAAMWHVDASTIRRDRHRLWADLGPLP